MYENSLYDTNRDPYGSLAIMVGTILVAKTAESTGDILTIIVPAIAAVHTCKWQRHTDNVLSILKSTLKDRIIII